MQLLDNVLNNTLQKPFANPPPVYVAKRLHEEEESNDFVLPLLSKTQVLSQLSIRFKHLKLEVDKQRIQSQLATSHSTQQQEESGYDMLHLADYSEAADSDMIDFALQNNF